MSKKKQIIALILNLAVVICEIIATSLSIHQNGFKLFQFYTEDSNLFALLACLILSIYLIIGLIKKKYYVPKWVTTLKYFATCFLTITFLVVIFILIPMMSKAYPGAALAFLTRGSMLYQHLICPILVFISFVFIESIPLTKKENILSLLPTIIYAIILIILNILRVVEGPYP